MAKKLESPTSLTEFAPLSPESQVQTFSIRNLFRKAKVKPVAEASAQDTSETKDISTETITPSLFTDSASVSCIQISQDLEPSDLEKNRSMSGILKKIMSNVVDKKKKGLQNYKDSDFKQFWMPDSNCKECYECGDRFTTFRRRHHCRVCGQIFCKRCCNQEIPGNFIGYTDDLRVCTYCSRMVLSYVQSLDTGSDVGEDMGSFHDNLQQKIDSQNLSETISPQQTLISPARRKSSVLGFREEDIAKIKPSKHTLGCLTCRDHAVFEIDGNCQDKLQIKGLFDKLVNSVQSVPLWKQEYKSDHCTKVLLGSDIVDWLVSHDPLLTRQDAINIGQSFLEMNLFECIVPEQMKFIDGNVFYEVLEEISQYEVRKTIQRNTVSAAEKKIESLWMNDIQPVDFAVACDDSKLLETRPRMSSSNSMFYLDLDLKESRVSVSKPHYVEDQQRPADLGDESTSSSYDAQVKSSTALHPKIFNECMQSSFDDSVIKAFRSDSLEFSTSLSSIISSKNWQNSQLREDNGEKAAFEKLNSSFKLHEEILLNQLLSSEGLSLSWAEVILPLVHQVVHAVRPDIKNDADDMDIRQYVQFKKIPGGNKSECDIISGVVFSKTVAHKKMRQSIKDPTVLLLSSSITYQRVENKLSSIEPVIMQEFEYLRNKIGKLTVYKPDILLVEKTVSRLAQEMLLHLGITVILNVKPSVMERVARGTQAAIVSTIDAHLGRPHLGKCQEFKVKSYTINGGKTKNLIFFDGCPKNLSCTMLLRGGSFLELKKVKQIVQFMTYVEYNWQLERSFLMDEFAKEPSSFMKQATVEQSDNETSDCLESEIGNNYETSDCLESVIGNNNETSDCLESEIGNNNETSDFLESEIGNNNETLKIDTNNKLKLKCDDRKLETQHVSDFSDPLHSYLQSETDLIVADTYNLKVDSPPVTDSFRKLLNDIVLCTSLSVRFSLPHFETEVGKKCPLLKFFPEEIYWSHHFSQETSEKLRTMQLSFDTDNNSMENAVNNSNVELIPSHKFISYKVTEMSIEFMSLLADFRARGGTMKYLCPHERSTKGRKFQSESKQEQLRISMGNTALCWEKKIDVLDPYNHQTLAVLFCSYSCSSDNAPNYCVNPWVVKMNFYGSNDITLGGFLDRYCFRSTYSCPSLDCITPMTEHVRKFVHGSGCVHILLHELSTGVLAAEASILMWSWCHICRKATRVVSMSQETWSLSFAKYLELRFYADSYQRRCTQETCTHSLHHDHYQYFAHKQLVAIFKYTPILIWEIALPEYVISVNDKSIPVADIVEQIKTLNMKGHEIYSECLATLFALQKVDTGTGSDDAIDHMISQLELERPSFRQKIEEIQTNLTSPELETLQSNATEAFQNKELCDFMWKVLDQVLLLKFHIADVIKTWNGRIQDFVYARKKEEKAHSKTSQVTKHSELNSSFCESENNQPSCKTENQESAVETNPVTKNIERKSDFKIRKQSKRSLLMARSLSFESIFENVKEILSFAHLYRGQSEPKDVSYMSCESNVGKSPLDEERGSISSSDSCYAYGVTPGIYAGLMVPEPEDCESYVICHKDQQTSSSSLTKGHERSKSEGEEAGSNQVFRASVEKQNNVEGAKREKEKKEQSRVHKTLISQFLTAPSVKTLQSPFPQSEHFILPQTEKIPVIIYEDEPSSIIAYALSSTEYELQLQELRLNISNPNLTQRSTSTSPMVKRRPQNSKLQSESMSSSESPIFNDDIPVLSSSQETEKNSIKSGGRSSSLHLELQFSDATTTMSCKVYYAEQFRMLRAVVFGESEERFIRSLSHCCIWLARGGKSGSTFCKTNDDRFILKQMPKLELQSFLDLAPSYFQYLNKACKEQKPTLLAKIIGIFGIEFKNSSTNRTSKVDLLVMENLFYGRTVTRKYDLKGSVRNRLINTSGLQEDDIVLQDENLLKVLCDNPLYMRAHSKTVLTLAINNDTQFLAEQAVMDYSLLVGLDEQKKELVVGIIDYIRTFTLDKKVESWIKSSGILGGHGKLPTVVSPELYKLRFCEAMDGYFLWIPDRWTGLGKGIDG